MNFYEAGVPMRVIIGWSEGISKNDAVEVAKGFIQRRFDAIDASWYAIAPFMGGYFWEVHEGGPGDAYLPAVIKALSDNPGARHWLPSGDRAFSVMMRDGKPFCILLSSDESKTVITSGTDPLLPGGKMHRAVNKGTSVLIAGVATSAVSALFLSGSLVFYGLAAHPEPSVRDLKLDLLPYAQWESVVGVAPNEIVSKLELKGGKWAVVKRSHVPVEETPPAEPETAAEIVPSVNVELPVPTYPPEIDLPKTPGPTGDPDKPDNPPPDTKSDTAAPAAGDAAVSTSPEANEEALRQNGRKRGSK